MTNVPERGLCDCSTRCAACGNRSGRVTSAHVELCDACWRDRALLVAIVAGVSFALGMIAHGLMS